MSKSRGRKTGKQPRARANPEGRHSGEPGRAVSPTREWRIFISTISEAELSDSLVLPSLPALYLNAVVSPYQDMLPSGRCVDDCLVLAHSYAQFGIEAQVRTAVLTITDSATGAMETHGSLQPLWEDGMLHGHTVVWLPAQRILIDPTAEQYEGIDAYREGPVIAQGGPARDDRQLKADGKPRVTTARGFLRLRYQLGSADDARAVLGHPVVRAEGDGHRRRGLNVASNVGALLTARPEEDTAAIPYPRAAALISALRRMDRQEDEDGNVVFRLSGPGPSDARLVKLDEIALPGSVPPAAPTPTGTGD